MRNHFPSACCCCWLVRTRVRTRGAPHSWHAWCPPISGCDPSPGDSVPAQHRAATGQGLAPSHAPHLGQGLHQPPSSPPPGPAPLLHHLPMKHKARRVQFVFPRTYNGDRLGCTGGRAARAGLKDAVAVGGTHGWTQRPPPPHPQELPQPCSGRPRKQEVPSPPPRARGLSHRTFSG